uniref:Glucuronosyltransferase n=1 Tax=Steinernema glaseri TaxID=37863 RepID=A0A1I7Y359_9BILA
MARRVYRQSQQYLNARLSKNRRSLCAIMARLIALFALAFLPCDALKILMYNPSMGHSHMAFQGAIADILIDAGHTVVGCLDRKSHDYVYLHK